MDISQFPLFSDLSIAHRQQMSELTSRFLPYSDFNFTSLFAWDINASTQVALLHGNLIVKMADYITGEVLFSCLGDNNIDQTLLELTEVAPRLSLVPGAVVDSLQNKLLYTVNEDRDNFDYVYELELLAKLPGGEFKKRRNKLAGVQRALEKQGLIVRSLPLQSHQDANLNRIFTEWAAATGKHDSETENEQKALQRLMQYADQLSVQLTEIMLDGKLVGFSLNEVLDNEYAMCHFEKALPVHDNIYAFLSNQAALHLFEQGCKYVNWEQDLGLAGLRQSKLSYRPKTFLKKYDVARTANAG